jgi:ketopantoate reductase
MENARILLVGCGGIGCIAALNLESGGRAQVTAVLRSSYDIVKERGFTINSVDHGQVRGFRPTESRLHRIPHPSTTRYTLVLLLTISNSFNICP